MSAHVLLALALLLATLPMPLRAAGPGSLRLEVRTVVTTGGAREVLTSSRILAPPSTVVRVTAEEGGLRIAARFVVTADGDRVRVGARVETRRPAGRSARGLALHEEETTSDAARLAGDGTEALAVYPFGRDPEGDELAIEIVPARDGRSLDAPEIRIDRPGPGWVRVEVEGAPTRFRVDAELREGERTIATGTGDAFFDEATPIGLVGTDGAPAAEVAITIDRLAAGCPPGVAGFAFDLDRVGSRGAAPLARRWAGAGPAGVGLDYPLDGWPGRTLRLRWRPHEEAR